MNRIHLIDCQEFMKTVPDKYYDLGICDPPYGIDINMNMGRKKGEKRKHDIKNWDKSIPDELYFAELSRITQNQIIWGGNYFLLPPTRCFLIWDKGEGFKNRTYAEAELAWTSFNENVRIFKHDPLANGDYKGKINPCQKPVALYKWLLKNYGKPGQSIFDSHIGSGSIRIACHDLGFDLEGCELDKDYFEAQEARFKRHISQGDLFGSDEIQGLVYD